MIVGILGLAVSFAGLLKNHEQFYHSYLVAFTFWTSIGLGGLFFTMLHHLTGSIWSVVIRRISEAAALTLPVMGILFIPILLNQHDLYHWSHHDAVAHDAILQMKAPYLNSMFFIIRSVVYFAIWTFLAIRLAQMSKKQDEESDNMIGLKMARFSAPGMIIFALTITFASFDWLMSLNPHWYSTIFGLYYYAGCVMGIFSFFTLTAIYLKRKGVLEGIVSVEHYHDFGKLMFTFMVFWTYMAFSQYLLIWYANLPEETVWYHQRGVGSWKTFSLVIVFGHFAIPFFALMTRAAKRSETWLIVMALWLLLFHWLDMYWNVMPTLHPEGVSFSWMDVTTMIGFAGVFKWAFWRRYSSQPVVPIHDPKLQSSINFVNI
jgi:hypothetical protein